MSDVGIKQSLIRKVVKRFRTPPPRIKERKVTSEKAVPVHIHQPARPVRFAARRERPTTYTFHYPAARVPTKAGESQGTRKAAHSVAATRHLYRLPHHSESVDKPGRAAAVAAHRGLWSGGAGEGTVTRPVKTGRVLPATSPVSGRTQGSGHWPRPFVPAGAKVEPDHDVLSTGAVDAGRVDSSDNSNGDHRSVDLAQSGAVDDSGGRSNLWGDGYGRDLYGRGDRTNAVPRLGPLPSTRVQRRRMPLRDLVSAVDSTVIIDPDTDEGSLMTDRSNCGFCYWSQLHTGWQHNDSLADVGYLKSGLI
jgi:hypothetical protein